MYMDIHYMNGSTLATCTTLTDYYSTTVRQVLSGSSTPAGFAVLSSYTIDPSLKDVHVVLK